MSWQGIEGHDETVAKLRTAWQQGRLGSAYLLTGPSGIGKCHLAHALAQTLLCDHPSPEFAPCGQCESCRLFVTGSHPDFLRVACEEDQRVLPLELLIGERQHRAREGLCFWISLAPVHANRKIAILEDADLLAEEGANALLKTLEEPPIGSVLFLISHNLQRQLPTIRSRCQILFCPPLDVPTLARLIQDQGLASTPEEAERLAQWSAGSLEVARELADPAWAEFLGELERLLARQPVDGVAIGREVAAFVDQAGESVPAKRSRLRQVVRLVSESLRQQLRQAVMHSDAEALQWELMRQIDHCLLVMQQIDANAHLPTLIDAWTEALAGTRLAAVW